MLGIQTWLDERCGAIGQLVETVRSQSFVARDLQGFVGGAMGFYDLISEMAFIGNLYSKKKANYPHMQSFPSSHYSPDTMSAAGVR